MSEDARIRAPVRKWERSGDRDAALERVSALVRSPMGATFASTVDAAFAFVIEQAPSVKMAREGARLRQARERNNMSQRALALILGDDTHSHQRVGRMERGGEELSAEARSWLETVAGGEVAQ